ALAQARQLIGMNHLGRRTEHRSLLHHVIFFSHPASKPVPTAAMAWKSFQASLSSTGGTVFSGTPSPQLRWPLRIFTKRSPVKAQLLFSSGRLLPVNSTMVPN